REDGSGFDASKVEVTLADIPFVRLREGLPQDLLRGSRSFSATVAAAQRRFDPPQVRLDWQRASLTCGGIPPKLLTLPANASAFTPACTGKPAATHKWRWRCAMASPKRGLMNVNRIPTKRYAPRSVMQRQRRICCTRMGANRARVLG
ncbi:MAG: hypothetical protein ACK4RS_06265, partial [Thiothrix sp.]